MGHRADPGRIAVRRRAQRLVCSGSLAGRQARCARRIQPRQRRTDSLDKGFFAIDLDEVRAAVAKLPWVERAEARKRWPDTIDLVIYERQPYARWGADRLVSRSGGLFTVAGTEGLQGLPLLSGPDDRLDDVLEFYADCVKEFSGSGLVIDAVTLSSRGGWKLDIASGAVIAVGRDDAKQHLARFLDVWPSLVGAHPEAPAYIDLRYENGFALRWQVPQPIPSVVPPLPAENHEPGIGQVPTARIEMQRATDTQFALVEPRFALADSRRSPIFLFRFPAP